MYIILSKSTIVGLKEEIFLFTKVIIIFNSRAMFRNSLVFAAALTFGDLETVT